MNPSPRQRLAIRLVLARLSRWRGGALDLILPDGKHARFGDPEGAAVPVQIKSWDFFWRTLLSGGIGAGESFMDGEWECDDLTALCRMFAADENVLDARSGWNVPSRLGHALLRWVQRNTQQGSRRNIRYHYDLGNDLYRLFLDDSLTYSCGLFENGATTLEEAQQAKIDRACRRLDLRPGLQVLEIGSGWGSFALHAARRYGCRVTSITLSQEQLALARERVHDAGLDEKVDIRLCDYRDMTGSFDRIASIEMFEAVGYEYYGAFFGSCDRLLRPGGKMFLQTITVPDERFDIYRRGFDWTRKYIFPGGLLASVRAIRETVTHSTSLWVESVEEIGPHYAHTLRAWRERFLARLADVRRLGFDDRFIRMWEFYLASCEAAFAARAIGDVQIVLARR